MHTPGLVGVVCALDSFSSRSHTYAIAQEPELPFTLYPHLTLCIRDAAFPDGKTEASGK